MRYPSLDGAPALTTDPGADTIEKPLSYWVDGFLAAVGHDGQIDPEEGMEAQRLLAGLQAIAQQKMAAQGMAEQPASASGEASDFGDTGQSEDVNGPEPGAEYAGAM